MLNVSHYRHCLLKTQQKPGIPSGLVCVNEERLTLFITLAPIRVTGGSREYIFQYRERHRWVRGQYRLLEAQFSWSEMYFNSTARSGKMHEVCERHRSVTRFMQ
jgi:hypothetical protein